MASLYDSASLVMIPSGVKEDKLYSIKPTDGSGDFTFSRDADIEATRVNSSGLIEKAKVNLALQSNQFDTTWTLNNVSVTGGQTGYDGSSDAWLLTNSAGGAHINQSVSGSGVVTISVYAKAGTLNWMRLTEFSGSNAWFDLQNGVVGSTFSGTNTIDRKIESVGGGWYRCSMTTLSGGNSFRIYPATADNDESSTGNIVIQDAQRNHGLIAQDYVETTTTSVVEGLTADLPRLDYSGGASCPSLLLEPSRTNLIEYSEYFGASDWTKGNVSVTDNVATSPEGVLNAAKLIEDSSNSTHYIADTISTSSGVTHSFSLFAKKAENRYIRLSRAGGSVGVGFDLENGDFVEGGGAIGDTQDFGNGWYKCIMTFDTNVTSTQIRVELSSSLSAVNDTYLGDGTSGIFVYGAQLEAGSYPTSYIPTYGTAANRGVDYMETGTLPTISGGEVSFFLDIDGAYDPNTNSTSSNFRWAFTSDFVTWNNNGASSHRIRVTSALGNEYFTAAVNRDSRCKIIALLTATEAKVYANGVLVGTETISADWSTTNFIDTAITNGVGQVPIKQCLLFPTRLTDAEAIALTTI